MTKRAGILAGGNWIVDKVKLIDAWPQQDALCRVLESRSANGGFAYNMLKDLSRLGAPFPLWAAGLLGTDADADFVLKDCAASKIDSSMLLRRDGLRTPSTDVMTEKCTGRRTFFYDGGATEHFDFNEFDISRCPAKIVACGYMGLLRKMDACACGASGYARFFERARALGFETATDFVSVDADLGAIAKSALPHIDYISMNEIEASRLMNLENLDSAQKKSAAFLSGVAAELFAAGLGKFALIHFKEGAFGFAKNGEVFRCGALNVPKDSVAGANGCGDALFAGFLYGVHEGAGYEESLRLGICAAAACLCDASASGGLLAAKACLKLARRFGFGAL